MLLRVLLLCLLSSAALAAPQDPPITPNSPGQFNDLENDFLISLLTEPSPEQMRFGAKAAESIFEKDAAVLDVMAQRLWESSTTVTRENLDAVAWLARALGSSGQARYRDLLASVQTKAQDKKLQSHVQQALKQLPAGSGAAFVPDQINLEQLRSDARTRLEALRTEHSHTPLSDARPGLSLGEVLARFGLPDAVDTTRSTVDVPGPFPTLYAYTVQLMYFDRGAIRLDYKHQWRVLHAVNAMRAPALRYEGPYPVIAHNLMLPGPDALRILMKQLPRSGGAHPSLLPALADRLWLSRNTDDDLELDALKYICKYLVASGDAKWRPALEAFAQSASHKGLREYALKSAEKLPSGMVTDWQAPQQATSSP